jgi:ubiquinone/menaquinone biosynthesis C-methylase UbiE
MSNLLHHHAHPHTADAPATTGRLIRWARYYDPCVSLLMLGARRRFRRATVDLARIRPGEAVLEVGCGTGDVAILAKRWTGPAGTVQAIDPASEMLAVARSKAARAGVAVDFQVGLIEALAFPDDSFDVVLSSLMMHHLPDELKRRGLAEIARVLKPGGRLLIVDFKRPAGRLGRIVNGLFLHSGLQVGVQDLPPLLQAAGFVGVDAGDTGFPRLGYVQGRVRD